MDACGEAADGVAEVRAERRVVEAPVLQLIRLALHVPRARRQVESHLHPVALRLKVTIHGRLALARVAVESDARAHEQCEQQNNRRNRRLVRGDRRQNAHHRHRAAA